MNFLLVLEWLIKGFVWAMVLLGGFAYLTLYERKALARIQSRIGPNRAGPWGILQPIADAVKLIFKEELTPANADKLIFLLAPVITVVPAVVITAVVPWGPSLDIFGYHLNLYIADINVGVLYIMSIASIAVYGIVLAGWSSNNKYAMMGGLRSTAQMISYEIALGLSFVSAILLAGSMRMLDIVEAQGGYWFHVIPKWFVVLQPVGTAIFLIATLAEVNRAPFDMPEAEQELTAGYHTEYSGMKFALLVHGRIHQDDRHQCHRRHPFLRRATTVPFVDQVPLAWTDLHVRQDHHPAVWHDLGAGHLPAHPL